MNRTLADFARTCGGELLGADRAYAGVSTDTRSLKAGELFVALRGPRFNANDFVAAAEAAGAAGAVVESRVDRPLPQIVVRDTQEALTQGAAAWRALHHRGARHAHPSAPATGLIRAVRASLRRPTPAYRQAAPWR